MRRHIAGEPSRARGKKTKKTRAGSVRLGYPVSIMSTLEISDSDLRKEVSFAICNDPEATGKRTQVARIITTLSGVATDADDVSSLIHSKNTLTEHERFALLKTYPISAR